MASAKITELSTGFPGYDSVIGKDTATLGRILQANGYATSWFGKDHNVPLWQATENGPFDQWATGMGFDYFYGFLGGDMNQWFPSIWQNTTKIFASVGHPGYNLNIDLADQAIRWVNNMTNIAPKQPLFLYYAPGATHAPHQPTPEWIAKFKGKFDYGWNAYRDYTFKRQKQMGTIPQNAKLTPWPDFLPQWDSLTPVQKKVYSHQMEVYAAFLSETDYEVNRVIEAFKDNNRYDNTLIIYIDGDNGASAEGTLTGTPNEFVGVQGMNATVDQMAAMLPEWGGPKTYAHFAVPWAFAMDTPFQWTKQIASYFGGTKNGMLVVWPHHMSDPGAIRMQFAHVVDVVPTVLEAAGIQQPDVVDGVKQKPIEGVSFAYTFDAANANAPSQHHTQYFEMFANMAIYNDGWVAATTPFTKPWDALIAPRRQDPWAEAEWNLYHVTPEDDWSEATDVKAQNPAKLKQLQDLFLSEAAKYQVFPLNNAPLPNDARPSLTAGINPIVYRPGLVDLYVTDTPNVIGTSYRIDGDVVVPSGGANGVLVAMGGEFGGYSMYLQGGRPVFSYNLLGVLTERWKGAETVGAGEHIVTFDFKYDGGGFGKGGVGTLSVDGKLLDTHRIEHTVPFLWPWDDGLSIGQDTLTAVDANYKVPNAFTGTIKTVTYTYPSAESASMTPKPEDLKRLGEAKRRTADMIEWGLGLRNPAARKAERTSTAITLAPLTPRIGLN